MREDLWVFLVLHRAERGGLLSNKSNNKKDSFLWPKGIRKKHQEAILTALECSTLEFSILKIEAVQTPKDYAINSPPSVAQARKLLLHLLKQQFLGTL